MINDIIGWIGVICLTASGAPQLYKTLKVKHVNGLSLGTFLLWFVGCFLMMINSIVDDLKIHLILNYVWSSVLSGAIVVCFFIFKHNKNNRL